MLLLKSQHAVGMKAGQHNLGRVTCWEQKLRALDCCWFLELIARTGKLGLVCFLKPRDSKMNKGLTLLYKEFFYTKRTESSLNIIQLSRGICTLSILYFWPSTLLKQTAFPFHMHSIFWYSYFQKVSVQSGVVVLVQTSLISARASEVKLDPLTPSQNKRDPELKDVAS